MQDKYQNVTIALAGMLQSVALVRELTQTGRTNMPAFESTIHSILRINAKSVPEVFGGIYGVKLGLEKIVHAFDARQTTDRLQKPLLVIINLFTKKLSRSPKILTILMKRLEQIRKQADYFSITHPTVISNLADIYLNTISTFHFRVVILGTERVLHAKENMEKVRALLLSGVRAAVLWRQVGGSRLQILFSRAKIKACAEMLLAQLNENLVMEKDTI